ncbi:MAG: peptidoglycan DD-metalloendopeptidase family protein, partial [Myxococcota bacterium]|nr:peptidoglycan DD-metalloendopeptidase family protein [Myxococcota bacterium]
MPLNRIILSSIMVVTIAVLTQGLRTSLAAPSMEELILANPPEPTRMVQRQQHKIQKGETFGGIMQQYGIGGVDRILAAARPHFDLSRIRVGKTLTIRSLQATGAPLTIHYPLDEDRTLVVQPGEYGASASVEEITYERGVTRRAIEMTGTLWDAALAAGLRPSDIVRLARVFQWEVDFNTELRTGARMTLVADELLREGESVRLDTYHAVRLENAGEIYTAIRHVSSNGDEGWYGPDGKARKRPFLRSPLEFSRVTSGFTRKRFHPVLKRNRPHLGTDFGAPRGTPIRAVGDGVISHSGTSGGYGKLVKINHSGPYETRYAHLSRILVRHGQRVKQGQIIGHVGATGLATGPHLH